MGSSRFGPELDLTTRVGLAALCTATGQAIATLFRRFHCPWQLVFRGEVRLELF
jgi:hypothetical protein